MNDGEVGLFGCLLRIVYFHKEHFRVMIALGSVRPEEQYFHFRRLPPIITPSSKLCFQILRVYESLFSGNT
jgi:hypothetical protein